MRSRRNLALLTALLMSACAGDAGESAGGGAEETAQAEMEGGDEAALLALGEYYETHYNMHHASMVADVFDPAESMALWADGTVSEGRAGVEAYLEGQMGGTPTLDLNTTDQMVFGDVAVGYGTYGVEATPPGMDPATMSGSWLGSFNRQDDGTWKIGFVITNYDHEWPEGQMAAPTGEEPVEEGTMDDLTSGYELHYNMNHPSMVADFYTEDATLSLSGSGFVQGRTAIDALLAERMGEGGTALDIHEVGTMELGDGWALDGGWWEMDIADGGDRVQSGSFMNLLRQQEDGSWQIHWSVTNAVPADAGGM